MENYLIIKLPRLNKCIINLHLLINLHPKKKVELIANQYLLQTLSLYLSIPVLILVINKLDFSWMAEGKLNQLFLQ